MYILTTHLWRQLSKSCQLTLENNFVQLYILKTHFEDYNVHPDNSFLETILYILYSTDNSFSETTMYILTTHLWRQLCTSLQLTFGNNYVHPDNSVLGKNYVHPGNSRLETIMYILTTQFWKQMHPDNSL